MKILTQATPLALWYEAIQEAQKDSQIGLETDVEAYLVYLLMRSTQNSKLLRELLACKFLNGVQKPVEERGVILQDVGDNCLLLTGLFPAFAEKRLVKIRYYIELGKISYEVISRKNDDIFSHLSKQFVMMMAVLQSFRPYTPATLPAGDLLSWEPRKKE